MGGVRMSAPTEGNKNGARESSASGVANIDFEDGEAFVS
jgi:hypothetical protein